MVNNKQMLGSSFSPKQKASTSRSTRTVEKVMEKLQELMSKKDTALERCGLSAQALHVLRKPIHQRTDLDVTAIASEMAKQVWHDQLPNIMKINRIAFQDVVRQFQAVTHMHPEVPIQDVDDPVDTFYVVLSGSATITESKEVEGKVAQYEDVPRKLVPGHIIGENFMDENAVWKSALQVEEGGVEVLELTREAYSKAVKPHLETVIRDWAHLLQNVSIFSNFDLEACIQLASLMKHQFFPSNSTIVKQGDLPNDIYFIIKGHCRVVQAITVPAPDMLVLRKPFHRFQFSTQSSSGSTQDARRRPVSLGGRGGNLGAGTFLSPIHREMPPPRRGSFESAPPMHNSAFSVPTHSTSSVHTDDLPFQDMQRHTWRPSHSAQGRRAPPKASPVRPSTSRDYTAYGGTPRERTSGGVGTPRGSTPRSAMRTPRGLEGTPTGSVSKRAQIRTALRSPPYFVSPAGAADHIRPFTGQSLRTPDHVTRVRSQKSPLSGSKISTSGSHDRISFASPRKSVSPSGSVYEVGHTDEHGNKKVMVELRELWRGQYFGELGIVQKVVRSASVITMSAVECLALSKLDFFRLGMDGGEVAEKMLKNAQTLQYVYEPDIIRQLMVKEFKWRNYKQDLSSDIVYGSTFLEGKPVDDLDSFL